VDAVGTTVPTTCDTGGAVKTVHTVVTGAWTRAECSGDVCSFCKSQSVDC